MYYMQLNSFGGNIMDEWEDWRNKVDQSLYGDRQGNDKGLVRNFDILITTLNEEKSSNRELRNWLVAISSIFAFIIAFLEFFRGK
jgi:hypothetical protein